MTSDAAKIRSIQEVTQTEAVRVYRELYEEAATHIRMKMRWRGIHSLLYALIKDKLPGKTVLDLGCGHGRMPFLCARRAHHVVGVELEGAAVRVARLEASALGIRNVEFVEAGLGDYRSDTKFDFVIMAGVLRHLIDRDEAFRAVQKNLAEDGTFILGTTIDANFRADVSNSFFTLLQWPMSLNDFHRFSDQWLHAEAPRWGLTVEGAVGSQYSQAWADVAVEDLLGRFANVYRDLENQGQKVRADMQTFEAWLNERAEHGRSFIRALADRKILKRIPRRGPFRINESVLRDAELSDASIDAIREYLAEDFSRDPYYSDVPPFSLMGAQVWYFLRRAGSKRRHRR